MEPKNFNFSLMTNNLYININKNDVIVETFYLCIKFIYKKSNKKYVNILKL